MTEQEFLMSLERALRGGGISEYDISDNINYYKTYFREQISMGRSEREIAEELGDPRLIAKTIIGVQEEEFYEEAPGNYENGAGEDPKMNPKGFHAEFNENGWDVRYGKFKINSWYGYLVIALIIFTVLSLIFTFISGLFHLIAPIAVPILLVLLVYNVLFKRR